MVPPEWQTSIPARYSFIDPGRMKGWVGLVGWPIVDVIPTCDVYTCMCGYLNKLIVQFTADLFIYSYSVLLLFLIHFSFFHSFIWIRHKVHRLQRIKELNTSKWHIPYYCLLIFMLFLRFLLCRLFVFCWTTGWFASHGVCAFNNFISHRVDWDVVFRLQSFAAGTNIPWSLGQVSFIYLWSPGDISHCRHFSVFDAFHY